MEFLGQAGEPMMSLLNTVEVTMLENQIMTAISPSLFSGKNKHRIPAPHLAILIPGWIQEFTECLRAFMSAPAKSG